MNDELIIASQQGNIIIIRHYLLTRGLNINARNKYNMTMLHIAVSWGQLSLVKFLLENGANAEAKDDYGRTPRDKIHTADIQNLFEWYDIV